MKKYDFINGVVWRLLYNFLLKIAIIVYVLINVDHHSIFYQSIITLKIDVVGNSKNIHKKPLLCGRFFVIRKR